MRKYHAKNEQIKHQYLAYLEEARRFSVKSADIAAAAIADFEKSTGHKDFAAFHIEQARKYKRDLLNRINPKTKKPLAVATVHSRLLAVKAFFFWLAGQPGYKSRISYSDCEYFNPSANDSHIANAKRQRPAPSLEQIKYALSQMPFGTDIEKRNRALIAVVLLTGARADALTSLKIKNVDLQKRFVYQDARTVRTKFRKSMKTTFFPVGDGVEDIAAEWIDHLTNKLLFNGDDPLFPSTLVRPDQSGGFAAKGLQRTHWSSTGPIRYIFKRAFEAADLPYFHPHSIRHTLAQLGEKICKTPEEFKAWSQNLAHENVLTTFTSYGTVSENRQSEIIKQIVCGNRGCDPHEITPKLINRVLVHLQEREGLNESC